VCDHRSGRRLVLEAQVPEAGRGQRTGEVDDRLVAAHDDGTAPVVDFGEPISSRYVLVKRDHLTNVTSLEHERWEAGAP